MDLSAYYTQICKTPFLSKAEELSLFEEYYNTSTSESRKGQIRDSIIKANLRFAFNEARKRCNNDPELFAQLISAANEGLLVGFEKFTLGRGRFSTYAGWWVLQRILNEKSKMRLVSLPVWKQQLSAKIEKIREQNESITLAELKKQFPEKHHPDVEELFTTRYLTFYLEDIPGSNSIADSSFEKVESRLDNEYLAAMLEKLPDPHRSVIEALYGFEDESSIPSTTSLANRLGLTKEKVLQVKREALELLRVEYGVSL